MKKQKNPNLTPLCPQEALEYVSELLDLERQLRGLAGDLSRLANRVYLHWLGVQEETGPVLTNDEVKELKKFVREFKRQPTAEEVRKQYERQQKFS